MKTAAIRLASSLLFGACLSLAIASPAHAALDGINRLILVTQQKADSANADAMAGADKQRELIKKKKDLKNVQDQLDAAAAPTSESAVKGNLGMKQKSWNPANFRKSSPVESDANRVAEDVDAIVAFEATASADGVDDAELKQLGDLVGVAREHVDAAISGASTEMATAKKELAAATDADEKARLKLHLKSLRSTVKAHRQTSAALKTLAKRIAA
jgi:hypothetical protein